MRLWQLRGRCRRRGRRSLCLVRRKWPVSNL